MIDDYRLKRCDVQMSSFVLCLVVIFLALTFLNSLVSLTLSCLLPLPLQSLSLVSNASIDQLHSGPTRYT